MARHVFDGSAFSTSIGVNPQESIYALSLRQIGCLLKLVFLWLYHATATLLVCADKL
jgi:hypothetical protein